MASEGAAGVASLADFAGSVAGVMTKLPVPICAGTGEITLQQEYIFRDCLGLFGCGRFCEW